jgi:hypothetical protein
VADFFRFPHTPHLA